MCAWTGSSRGERVRRREKGNQLNEYYFILLHRVEEGKVAARSVTARRTL